MANRHRAAKLALCRSLLDHERTAPNDGQPSPVDPEAQTWAEVPACPDCGGVMPSLSAFDTASATPALEHHRSDATHREPKSCRARDHHRHSAPSVSIIADDGRIRAVTLRDDNVRCSKKSIAISAKRVQSQLFPDAAHLVSLPHAPRPADRALRSRTSHSCKTAHSLPPPSFNPASIDVASISACRALA